MGLADCWDFISCLASLLLFQKSLLLMNLIARQKFSCLPQQARPKEQRWPWRMRTIRGSLVCLNLQASGSTGGEEQILVQWWLSQKCPELMHSLTPLNDAWVSTPVGHYCLEGCFRWMTQRGVVLSSFLTFGKLSFFQEHDFWYCLLQGLVWQQMFNPNKKYLSLQLGPDTP